MPNFTGESTTELDIAVLRSNLNTVAHKLRGRDEVDGGRGNDHLYNPRACTKAKVPLESPSSVARVHKSSPTLGSKEATFKALTKPFLASRETGFILKFPPTKNLRTMAADAV